MKKLLAIQISIFILISGTLGGLVLYTDVYEDVQFGIVSVLCLSCVKLDPKSVVDFTFNTANLQPHPDFVLDNLSKGPVFLAFREDVCLGCDIMEPIIQDIFEVEFEKEQTVVKTMIFNDNNVTFIHINLDHAPQELKDSFFIYDQDHVGGVPMFTVITLGYDHGFVKISYSSVYGTLDLDEDMERKVFLLEFIQDGIDRFNQNKAGYH